MNDGYFLIEYSFLIFYCPFIQLKEFFLKGCSSLRKAIINPYGAISWNRSHDISLIFEFNESFRKYLGTHARIGTFDIVESIFSLMYRVKYEYYPSFREDLNETRYGTSILQTSILHRSIFLVT